MPELPDVETMRRYLQATSLHQQIDAVLFQDADYLLSDDPNLEPGVIRRLKKELTGRCFASTHRHGKWLFAALTGGEERFLVLHFGMTGGLKYFRDMADEPEYDRMRLDFVNGYHLAYVSMRKLGAIRLASDIEAFIEDRDLGPDVLDAEFDFETFREITTNRRTMVKALLMDQRALAGLGNVYADEILFQAGIHPRVKVDRLDDDELRRLYKSMKAVMRTAIDHQAQPVDLPESYLTVHRHDDGVCPRCGTELERVKVSSRTSYYCPNCQQMALR